jgi:hypothetical protein
VVWLRGRHYTAGDSARTQISARGPVAPSDDIIGAPTRARVVERPKPASSTPEFATHLVTLRVRHPWRSRSSTYSPQGGGALAPLSARPTIPRATAVGHRSRLARTLRGARVLNEGPGMRASRTLGDSGSAILSNVGHSCQQSCNGTATLEAHILGATFQASIWDGGLRLRLRGSGPPLAGQARHAGLAPSSSLRWLGLEDRLPAGNSRAELKPGQPYAGNSESDSDAYGRSTHGGEEAVRFAGTRTAIPTQTSPGR